MNKSLTAAMSRALQSASLRVGGNICPVRGVHSGAERALLKGLERRGLIAWDGPVPRINDAGRAAIISAQNELGRAT